MRFVTDLGKGILGQPDSTEMWLEITSHIPDSILLQKNLKILNLAFGHGTEADIIANRMIALGRSPQEVKDSIYLLDKYKVFTKDAVRKGYTNVFKEDFIEWETEMKFDVIIGNPPYQNPGKSKGEKLWYRFIRKSVGLLKDDGYLAFVTPNAWMTGGTNMSSGKWGVLKDVFCKYQLIFANVHNVTKKYFPNIGIQISYWVMQKSKITKESILELEDKTVKVDLTKADILSSEPNSLSISVMNKVLHTLDNDTFEVQYFQHHTKPGTYHEEITPTEKYCYAHWIMGSNVTDNLSIKYIDFDKSPSIRYNKIVMPVQSRYWQPYLDLNSVGALAQGYAIRVEDNVTQDGFKSVFYSNIFRYINKTLQIDKTGCMKTNIVRKLPKLDMSKVWTNKELYTYFNLSKEEINYIETYN
jgi:hypothetical protein